MGPKWGVGSKKGDITEIYISIRNLRNKYTKSFSFKHLAEEWEGQSIKLQVV